MKVENTESSKSINYPFTFSRCKSRSVLQTLTTDIRMIIFSLVHWMREQHLLLISEAREAPADLNKPIVFKAPSKSKSDTPNQKSSKRPSSSSDNKKSTKKTKGKPVLSFDDEEIDE